MRQEKPDTSTAGEGDEEEEEEEEVVEEGEVEEEEVVEEEEEQVVEEAGVRLDKEKGGKQQVVATGGVGITSETKLSPSPSHRTHPPPPPPPWMITQSVEVLRGLNGTLSCFLRQWDDLHCLLDSVGEGLRRPAPSVQEEQVHKAESHPPPPDKTELESICEGMQSKQLRKYMVAHLGDPDRLRREVPPALGRAPDPARLVLGSMGRFYLQASKAFAYPDSPASASRLAAILLLESLLLSRFSSTITSQDMDPSIQEKARATALAWRDRLISEGGVDHATHVDALVLVLFLVAFGILPEFERRDLYHLLRLSDLKKAEIFHSSPMLLEKIQDVIKDMVDKEMYVEAIDLVCAFQFEEKFQLLPLLSFFCDKSKQMASEERREGQCSLRSLKEANEKELARLKSVIKCTEDHKLELSDLDFNVSQRIAKLEKDIVKGEHKLKGKNLKRKAEEVHSLDKPETEGKHSWSASAEASCTTTLHFIKQSQEHGATSLPDSKILYDGLVTKNVHGGRATGMLNGSSTGALVGNLVGPGVSSGLSATAGGAGLPLRSSFGQYPGISGGTYGWPVDGMNNDISLHPSMLGVPSLAGLSSRKTMESLAAPSHIAEQSLLHPAFMSQITESRSSGSNLYQFADTVLEHESHYGNSSFGTGVPTANPGFHSTYSR